MSKLLKQIEKENELAQTQFIKEVQEIIDEIEKIKKENQDNINKRLIFQLNKELENIIKKGFEVLNDIENRLEEEQKKLGIYIPLKEDFVDEKYIAKLPLKITKVDDVQTGICPRCHGELNSDSNKNKCSCSQIIAWPA